MNCNGKALYVPLIVVGLMCIFEKAGAADSTPASGAHPTSDTRGPSIATASPASAPPVKRRHHSGTVGPNPGMVTEIPSQSELAIAAASAPSTRHMTTANMKKADHSLRAKVASALKKSKGVNADDVTVRARDGKVTLQGTVPDGQQAEKAGSVAAGVGGVKSVDNHLKSKSQ